MRRQCITPTCNRLAPIGKRKCNKCLPQKMTVEVLRPGNAGRNKRGTCLHKCDKPRTRRPKRQNVGGSVPTISSTKWGMG